MRKVISYLILILIGTSILLAQDLKSLSKEQSKDLEILMLRIESASRQYQIMQGQLNSLANEANSYKTKLETLKNEILKESGKDINKFTINVNKSSTGELSFSIVPIEEKK